jgi:hypothetical protein
MAFVVDKARDALKTELCAGNVGVRYKGNDSVNPPSWPRGFGIKASVVDPKIVGTTPPTGMATQAAYPIIDFAAFWLAKVVKTVRLH